MANKQHKDLTGTDLHVMTVDGTVNPTNLLSNGDFEAWSAGTSAAPDGWTKADAATGVAREGTIIKIGTYSAKVTTRNNTSDDIHQSIHTVKGIAYWKSRTVTFGCWVYADTANLVRVMVYDGITTQYSTYHTGNSTWQWLSKTATIASNATEVTLQLCFTDPTGTPSAYFDGAMCVEGDSAFAFSPKPAEEGVWADYSATSTIVGWTGAISPKMIYTKKIGKIVFVGFNLGGTSDSTGITFTLPYTSANDVVYGGTLSNAVDNGATVTTACRILLLPNTNTVNLYKDMATATWTNSGTKQVQGQFWYMIP